MVRIRGFKEEHQKGHLGEGVNSEPGQSTQCWVVERARWVSREVVADGEHLRFFLFIAICLGYWWSWHW